MQRGVQGGSDSHAQVPVYMWQAPGGDLSICLSIAVVRRLGALIRQRAKKHAERQDEVGGLLLGSVQPGEPTVTLVDDFEEFPSSHARGQSYVLTGTERRAFQKRMGQLGGYRRSLQPVGYFRSHSRAGLYLDQSDLSLMSECLPGSGNIALLVGTGDEELRAGFFFWESGDIRRQAPYQTFSFEADALMGVTPRTAGRVESKAPEQPPAAAPASIDSSGKQEAPPRGPGPQRVPGDRTVPPRPVSPVELRPPLRMPSPPPLPGARPRGGGAREVPVGLLWNRAWPWAAALVVAGLLLWGGVAVRRSVYPGIRRPSEPALALRVEKTEGGLKVLWDGHARAVTGARRAALNITDGESRYTLALSPAQLALGSMIYFPLNADVAFELVVSGARGESRAALRSFAPVAPGARPAPWRDLPQELPGFPPPETAGAFPLAQAERPAPELTGRVHRYASAPRSFRGPPETAPRAARQMAALPPPPQLTVPPAIGHNPVEPYSNRLDRKASVTVKPARSRLAKIPLLRRLQRKPQEGDGYVSARPVTQVRPAVPPGMEDPHNVEVKVRIDETGEVFDTEVLTRGVESLLANAAETAARNWRFAPAQKNGREVASELVLCFQFDR